MSHLPELMRDLMLILVTAAATTLLFKRLKQPVVLGYILAGFLASPYFHWMPTVYEIENIKVWAEIGVVFLLFGLGLEFSFRKLVKVGPSAGITAVVEVVGMLFLGYAVGRWMGWNLMDSLFLGGILSISSTTIIIRAFEEAGLKGKPFTSLVFGVLIIEDLVAIVLMVLLSTLAVSQQFSGVEMIWSIVKLGFFLTIWFTMGIYFVPTILKKWDRFMNEESLLILSVALCLLMVWWADQVGFSPALGAFIMGSVLAETTKAEQIEHLIKPVKDLFGAIFFVSVGMLIDPSIMKEYAGLILVLVLVTIVGKILTTSVGALLGGQTLKTSVQAGFSVAQIGEFSFIIATLGATLGVTSSFLYPVAVAVSAITTLTTPYLIKVSEPFYLWLQKVVPEDKLNRLHRYRQEAAIQSEDPLWKKFLLAQMIRLVLLLVVIIAISTVGLKWILPFVTAWFPSGSGPLWVARIVLLVLIAPFIWALMFQRTKLERKLVQELRSGILPKRTGHMLWLVKVGRYAMAILVLAFLLNEFFNGWMAIFILGCFFLILWKGHHRLEKWYLRMEEQFQVNLTERDRAD